MSNSVLVLFMAAIEASFVVLWQSFSVLLCSTPTEWSNFDCQTNCQRIRKHKMNFNGSPCVQFLSFTTIWWLKKFINNSEKTRNFHILLSNSIWLSSISSNYSFSWWMCDEFFPPSQSSDHLRASPLRIIINSWKMASLSSLEGVDHSEPSRLDAIFSCLSAEPANEFAVDIHSFDPTFSASHKNVALGARIFN